MNEQRSDRNYAMLLATNSLRAAVMLALFRLFWISLASSAVNGFAVLRVPCVRTNSRPSSILSLHATATTNRRDALLHTIAAVTGAAVATFVPGVALAVDDADLTTQLYNADGSLKDANTVTEAKSRPVEFRLQSDDDIVVNGKSSSGSPAGSAAATIRYELPDKWANNRYQDSASGRDTCKRISVYRIPVAAGSNNKNQLLSKAAQRGVTTTLDTERTIGLSNKADLIGGRSSKNSEYYEFDMARAPATCNANDAENLGLGFCPYDDIFLLSATVVDDRLYVMCIEADKDQWKFANAELRRIRSTFRVEV